MFGIGVMDVWCDGFAVFWLQLVAMPWFVFRLLVRTPLDDGLWGHTEPVNAVSWNGLGLGFKPAGHLHAGNYWVQCAERPTIFEQTMPCIWAMFFVPQDFSARSIGFFGPNWFSHEFQPAIAWAVHRSDMQLAGMWRRSCLFVTEWCPERPVRWIVMSCFLQMLPWKTIRSSWRMHQCLCLIWLGDSW